MHVRRKIYYYRMLFSLFIRSLFLYLEFSAFSSLGQRLFLHGEHNPILQRRLEAPE